MLKSVVSILEQQVNQKANVTAGKTRWPVDGKQIMTQVSRNKGYISLRIGDGRVDMVIVIALSHKCKSGSLAYWVECSTMTRETRIHSQVESYQRLSTWCLRA